MALRPSEPAAAEILGNRHAERASDRNQLAERRTFCEALDAEVGWMDAQNQRGPLADRRGVVGGARPVGRAHLPEDRARLGHHVRHAEATANLDELTAGNHDLAAVRERGEHQQRGRGVVVDDQRAFGAGETREEPCRVCVAASASAPLDVVFEIAVPAGDIAHPCDRRRRERGASHVRVQDDAGRVDDRDE